MAIESEIRKKQDKTFQATRYFTSHTGVISIQVEEGSSIEEGDLLYTITRLGLIKKRLATVSGIVRNINRSIENMFCGYYVHVLDVEHELTPEELQSIEEEREYQFVRAPQSAQYYITSNLGMPPLVSVGDIIRQGTVLAVAMVMKKRREIIYKGSRGKIAKIYFMNGQQCREGEKLFGVILRPI
jgi:biotin carboxyl carrier protein